MLIACHFKRFFQTVTRRSRNLVLKRALGTQYVVDAKEEEVEAAPSNFGLNTQNGRPTGYRTHNCGELRITDVGKTVSICGWVQKARDKNIVFMDVRDRYGITQCVVDPAGGDVQKKLYEVARHCGREYVVQVKGQVVEREAKNANRTTGDVEIVASELTVLNAAKEPPFKIEDKTDGKEDLRMKFRYLDIRRNPIKEALILRNKVTRAVRDYLGEQAFIEVETPVLIKSTPEGARDFVVPSRMNPGQFYALPQSPQTFKQILMVAGMDRYFQIVKCFRDEELRSDRQPEFTQIDCEMSFVNQEDILNTFESMIRAIFRDVVGHEFEEFPRMLYSDAMLNYGSDKPDLRFGMKLKTITDIIKGTDIPGIGDAEVCVSIRLPGVCNKGGPYASNKKIKKNLEKLMKGESVMGKKGSKSHILWCKVEQQKLTCNAGKKISNDQLIQWCKSLDGGTGDLLVCFCGNKFGDTVYEQMGNFRALMGTQLGYRGPDAGYSAHWVVDFPLLEYKDDRWNAMHHPFTAPKPEDLQYLTTDPGKVRANAYDLVINGVEVGGGSIRIHEKELQLQCLELLGFSKEEAQSQFGFLMDAFQYGAPPHGGLAFGLDRLCQILGGKVGLASDSIRDYIAFPKNNRGRDTMIESPSEIHQEQLDELCIATVVPQQDATAVDVAPLQARIAAQGAIIRKLKAGGLGNKDPQVAGAVAELLKLKALLKN